MSYRNCKTILLCLLAFLISHVNPAHRPGGIATTANSTLSPYLMKMKKIAQNKDGLVVDIITAQHPIYSKTGFILPELTFAIEYKRLHPKDKVRVFVPLAVPNSRGLIPSNSEEWTTIVSYFNKIERVGRQYEYQIGFKSATTFPADPNSKEKFSNGIFPSFFGPDESFFTEFEATDKNGNVIELNMCTSKHFTEFLDTERALDLWKKINNFTQTGDVTVMVGDTNIIELPEGQVISRHATKLLDEMKKRITKPHTLVTIGRIGQHYRDYSKQDDNILCLTLEPGRDVTLLPLTEKGLPSQAEKNTLRASFTARFQAGIMDRKLNRDVTNLLLSPNCVWAHVRKDLIMFEKGYYDITADSLFLKGAAKARGENKRHNLESVIFISPATQHSPMLKLTEGRIKDWQSTAIDTHKGKIQIHYNKKLQLALIELPMGFEQQDLDDLVRASDISAFPGDHTSVKAFNAGIVQGTISQWSKSYTTFQAIYKRANRQRAAKYLEDWVTLNREYQRFKSSYLKQQDVAKPRILSLTDSLTRQISELFTDKSFRDEFKLETIPGIKPFSVIHTTHTSFANDWNNQATRKAA